MTTGWPPVEAKCAEFGDTFDEWQRSAGRVILGKRADGIYAATIGGITLSIPRQVAKTFLVGRIVFALCVLFPGMKVLWTAHRTRTATNTFKTLQGYARRAKVDPYVLHIRTTNGEQEIAFTNGSVIMFGARETGFGRGFDEIDVEVFDEAQILTEKALDDMIAATNQSRHPHGALLFFMGTPPRPVDPGEVFTARRAEALAGQSEDAVYIECSADPDAKPDDRAQWAVANPSFPHRTPLRSMLRLRKNLLSDESWKREALGIWDPDDDGRQFLRAWLACTDPESVAEGQPVFAIDVSPGSRSAAIVAATRRPDGKTHLELVKHELGVSWVPGWCEQRKAHNPLGWVLDPAGPVGALLPDLADVGIEPTQMTARDLGQACEALSASATVRGVAHLGDPILTDAISGSGRRDIGDGLWAWSRRKSDADICPLVAATEAHWLLSTQIVTLPAIY